jgi:hypothetical protein
MNMFYSTLSTVGPIGLVGLWIFFMIQKKGWRITQILAGGLFALLLVSSFPSLPQAVHDGVTNIINSFSK